MGFPSKNPRGYTFSLIKNDKYSTEFLARTSQDCQGHEKKERFGSCHNSEDRRRQND